MGPLADLRVPKGQEKVNQLKWIDEENPNTRKKDDLRENDFKDDLLKKPEIKKIEIHRYTKVDDVKKSLRDRRFTLAQTTGVEGLSDFAKFS
jgi:hypothetical protein